MAPIHDAARAGDVSGLAKVVDVWGVETVHAQHHQTQFTPLMIAASRGHSQAVHFLLEHGACVDFVAKGYTALYLAAREGRGGVVALLLERGADPAIKTNVGWSTLMMASNRGHLDIVCLLLATGVDVDEQSNGGRTALWLACRWGHVQVAAALLRGGADYTLGTKDCDYGEKEDKSPKDVALEHGYSGVVDVIESVEKGYLLYKVRALIDAQLRQQRFPHLPPPPLLPPSHCPCPTPTVDVEALSNKPGVLPQTVAFVCGGLHEELFRELMEAFLPLPPQV